MLDAHACLSVARGPSSYAASAAQGFALQEADVDRVIQAARDLEAGQVVVDPSLPPQQNIDALLSVVRVLQMALDVQFAENEEVTADFNELQVCACGLGGGGVAREAREPGGVGWGGGGRARQQRGDPCRGHAATHLHACVRTEHRGAPAARGEQPAARDARPRGGHWGRGRAAPAE